MADCPSCGAPLKDGDWTCGMCGTPVAAGTVPEPAWAPEFQPQPAAAPAQSGASRLLRLILVFGGVAIIAIVAVWFFALRGPTTSGEEYLGTWTTSGQQGIDAAAITRAEDGFSVTLTASQQGQEFAVPAHIEGADLVITLDDFSQMAGEANAERLKQALEALAGDFRIVFSSVDATHLSLRIVGTSASGEEYDVTTPLVKDAAGTS